MCTPEPLALLDKAAEIKIIFTELLTLKDDPAWSGDPLHHDENACFLLSERITQCASGKTLSEASYPTRQCSTPGTTWAPTSKATPPPLTNLIRQYSHHNEIEH